MLRSRSLAEREIICRANHFAAISPALPFMVVPEIKIAVNFRGRPSLDAVVVTTRKSIHDLAREGHDFSRADRAGKKDGFSR